MPLQVLFQVLFLILIIRRLPRPKGVPSPATPDLRLQADQAPPTPHGVPSPSTPDLRLPVDREGGILGARDDDGWGDGFEFVGNGNDEDMINLVTAGMPKETAEQYLHIYELFLIHGASRGTAKAKVVELYSPPRITEEMRRIPNLGIVGGSTYDLFEGKDGRKFDFRKHADRTFVRREIAEQKPFMIIGSPPCTAFSPLMSFNKNKMKNYGKAVAEGRALLKFAIEIYKMQLDSGRHFVHEHPNITQASPIIWRLTTALSDSN